MTSEKLLLGLSTPLPLFNLKLNQYVVFLCCLLLRVGVRASVGRGKVISTVCV